MTSAGPDPIVVASDTDLRSMGDHLLSDERAEPAVALSWSANTGQLVLMPAEIRAIVGSGARIYVVTGKEARPRLEEMLGPKLALFDDSARIWWPHLTVHSDPSEHPAVLRLEDEPEASMLAEFARRFELSRPLVRQEIKLIEDNRALLDRELAEAREQQRKTDEHLREVQVERHQEATRATAAEARVESTTRELEALRIARNIVPPSPK
jgi:hypothetical protein